MSKLSEILSVFAPPAVTQASGYHQQIQQPRSIKLNFRNIVAMDQLKPKQAELYQNINELSLNHNKLKVLEGIEQFQNLSKLSITNNQIASPQALLSELSRVRNPGILQELHCANACKSGSQGILMDSNEFKSQIMQLFPNLQTLNGESTKSIRLQLRSSNVRYQQEFNSDDGSSSSSCFSTDWRQKGGPLQVEKSGQNPYKPFKAPRSRGRKSSEGSSSPGKRRYGASPGENSIDSKNQSNKYRKQIFGIQQMMSGLNQVQNDPTVSIFEQQKQMASSDEVSPQKTVSPQRSNPLRKTNKAIQQSGSRQNNSRDRSSADRSNARVHRFDQVEAFPGQVVPAEDHMDPNSAQRVEGLRTSPSPMNFDMNEYDHQRGANTIASNHQQNNSFLAQNASQMAADERGRNQDQAKYQAQQMTFANQDQQPVLSLMIQQEDQAQSNRQRPDHSAKALNQVASHVQEIDLQNMNGMRGQMDDTGEGINAQNLISLPKTFSDQYFGQQEQERQLSETQLAQIQYQRFLEEKQILLEKLNSMQQQYDKLNLSGKSLSNKNFDNISSVQNSAIHQRQVEDSRGQSPNYRFQQREEGFSGQSASLKSAKQTGSPNRYLKEWRAVEPAQELATSGQAALNRKEYHHNQQYTREGPYDPFSPNQDQLQIHRICSPEPLKSKQGGPASHLRNFLSRSPQRSNKKSNRKSSGTRSERAGTRSLNRAVKAKSNKSKESNEKRYQMYKQSFKSSIKSIISPRSGKSGGQSNISQRSQNKYNFKSILNNDDYQINADIHGFENENMASEPPTPGIQAEQEYEINRQQMGTHKGNG